MRRLFNVTILAVAMLLGYAVGVKAQERKDPKAEFERLTQAGLLLDPMNRQVVVQSEQRPTRGATTATARVNTAQVLFSNGSLEQKGTDGPGPSANNSLFVVVLNTTRITPGDTLRASLISVGSYRGSVFVMRRTIYPGYNGWPGSDGGRVVYASAHLGQEGYLEQGVQPYRQFTDVYTERFESSSACLWGRVSIDFIVTDDRGQLVQQVFVTPEFLSASDFDNAGPHIAFGETINFGNNGTYFSLVGFFPQTGENDWTTFVGVPRFAWVMTPGAQSYDGGKTLLVPGFRYNRDVSLFAVACNSAYRECYQAPGTIRVARLQNR